MTTHDDVDSTARLLGWESKSNGTYLRGDACIQVDYSSTGHILTAARYRFWKLDDLQLQERAGGRHKKSTVLFWLAT